MPPTTELLKQVLQLPERDRAEFAHRLLLSLEPEEFDEGGEAEIEAEWTAEAERRAEAYERGETTADDWRVVMERLRTSADSSRDANGSRETP